MGTSVSQASPKTVNWAAVAATYRSPAVPVERVVEELWRAAQSEPSANWRDLLSASVVAACLSIVIQSDAPAAALSMASREIALSRESSLATDIARQAIVQSFQADDRAQGFAEALFAGTADYLVSRDLAGHIGDVWRNRTVDDAIRFKGAIRERVANVVHDVGPPPAGEADAWRQYVSRAVDRLAG